MINRPRRLRVNEKIRSLVRETALRPEQLIYPMFVVEGRDIKQEIAAMPGQFRYSVDRLPAVQRAIAEIKQHSDIFITTDVCLCEYTSHGHCGVLEPDGYVNNDKTLALLAQTALSHVQAGADMVAPSDMMDGRVAAIRALLDENGYINTPIMSYAVKYASNFYGPFREAANSAPQHGDRKGYQMDYHNGREAEMEAALDVAEGADIIMVKPALPYLDVIARLRPQIKRPMAAYCVSGEYAMLQMAVSQGLVNPDIIYESHIAIKRAGADIILSYFAPDLAKIL